jgi:DNA repair exonuclease SbcCD ATPase subunit
MSERGDWMELKACRDQLKNAERERDQWKLNYEQNARHLLELEAEVERLTALVEWDREQIVQWKEAHLKVSNDYGEVIGKAQSLNAEVERLRTALRNLTPEAERGGDWISPGSLPIDNS